MNATTDPSLSALTCDQPTDLGVGEKLTCTGTRPITQGEINNGEAANTATVTGTDPADNQVSDSADEHVSLVQEPHLALAKQGTLDPGPDGRATAKPGDVKSKFGGSSEVAVL